MDEDGGDAVGKGVETEPYGLLAGLAAGHDEIVGALGQGVFVEEVFHLGGAVGRGDHHDERDGAGSGHRADGVDQHRCAAQHAERLGRSRAEPYPPACCGDHRGGAVGAGFVRHRLHSGRFVSSADMGMATACRARRLDRTLP